MATNTVPPEMDKERLILEELAALPMISAARLFVASHKPDSALLEVTVSQRDLINNVMRTSTCHSLLPEVALPSNERNTLGVSIKDAGPAQQLRDCLLRSTSPCGTYSLVIIAGTGESSCVLELWKGSSLRFTLQVPKALHGVPWNDGWVGIGAAWCTMGPTLRVAYVAETPAPERTPAFGGPAAESVQAAPPTWRGVGAWQEDWGERLVGKRPPGVFVLDIDSKQVQCLEGPADSSCGQPAWTPKGDGLVFTAWPHRSPTMPRMAQRLGMVYCFNRPAALHCTAWPPTGRPVRLTPPSLLHTSLPCFSPSGNVLVALSHDAAVRSGVHHATGALVTTAWPQDALPTAALPLETALPVVDRPEDDSAFPGLYASAFAGSTFIDQPFIDDDHFMTSTQWRNSTAIIVVHLPTGRVVRATPPQSRSDHVDSWSLLSLQHGIALAVCSHAGCSGLVYAACIPEDPMSTHQWHWVALSLDMHPPQPQCVKAIRQTCIKVTPTNGDTHIPMDATLVYNCDAVHNPHIYNPDDGRKPPAVLVPHGGPHAAHNAAWSLAVAYLAALGYTMILVNFRGSTGYGEAGVQSLPGHIGSHDVEDCRAALAAAVDAGYCDGNRVGIFGGSHGGFLGSSLVGQYPEQFGAAVLRNPVVDLSLMVHVTDIPDWCYVEAWGPEEGLKRLCQQPSEEDIRRFRSVSPVQYVDAIKTPLLFLLGAKDERVPMDDAKRMQWALLAREDAPPVRTIVFDGDNHALDQPQTEAEQLLNTAWWFKQYLM